MGAWNSYDDGNDDVADIVSELEHKLLPKSLAMLKTYRERPCKPAKPNCTNIYYDDEALENRKMQQQWMASHGDLVQREINKMNPGLNDQEIAGVARYLARGWGQTIEAKWPENIPLQLRKRAYQASQRQLNNMISGNNPDGYFRPKERIEALESQVKLFDPDQSQSGCVIS